MTTEEQLILDFNKLLAESVKIHGHLCAGQVLGVRMSLLGLREIGVIDPKGNDRKNIIVFVEMDRCATDAVQSVTGCESAGTALSNATPSGLTNLSAPSSSTWTATLPSCTCR